MKARVYVSLCMTAVLTFALPVTVPAAETAPAYDESGKETDESDEIIEPGVQTQDTEDEDLTKASVSEKVFPCYFFDIENDFICRCILSTTSPMFLLST